MLYNFNLYSAMCQLYLNKTGKNTFIINTNIYNTTIISINLQ